MAAKPAQGWTFTTLAPSGGLLEKGVFSLAIATGRVKLLPA